MGNAEREEGSSSPSVKVVTQLKRGAGGETVVSLSDGSSFFVPESLVLDFALRIGVEVSVDHRDELAFRSHVYGAAKSALVMLGRREYSRFQLKGKLLRKRFPEEAIEAALDELSESGELDDARFADEWIDYRMRRHPEGRSRLLSGLLRSGLDRELAESAVNARYTEEVEQNAATRIVEKMADREDFSWERTAARLRTRGFSDSVVRRIAESLGIREAN